jgi:hypothetical protein
MNGGAEGKTGDRRGRFTAARGKMAPQAASVKNGRRRRGSEMPTWRWGTGARISWGTNSPKAAYSKRHSASFFSQETA